VVVHVATRPGGGKMDMDMESGEDMLSGDVYSNVSPISGGILSEDHGVFVDAHPSLSPIPFSPIPLSPIPLSPEVAALCGAVDAAAGERNMRRERERDMRERETVAAEELYRVPEVMQGMPAQVLAPDASVAAALDVANAVAAEGNAHRALAQQALHASDTRLIAVMSKYDKDGAMTEGLQSGQAVTVRPTPDDAECCTDTHFALELAAAAADVETALCVVESSRMEEELAAALVKIVAAEAFAETLAKDMGLAVAEAAVFKREASEAKERLAAAVDERAERESELLEDLATTVEKITAAEAFIEELGQRTKMAVAEAAMFKRKASKAKEKLAAAVDARTEKESELSHELAAASEKISAAEAFAETLAKNMEQAVAQATVLKREVSEVKERLREAVDAHVTKEGELLHDLAAAEKNTAAAEAFAETLAKNMEQAVAEAVVFKRAASEAKDRLAGAVDERAGKVSELLEEIDHWHEVAIRAQDGEKAAREELEKAMAEHQATAEALLLGTEETGVGEEIEPLPLPLAGTDAGGGSRRTMEAKDEELEALKRELEGTKKTAAAALDEMAELHRQAEEAAAAKEEELNSVRRKLVVARIATSKSTATAVEASYRFHKVEAEVKEMKLAVAAQALCAAKEMLMNMRARGVKF